MTQTDKEVYQDLVLSLLNANGIIKDSSFLKTLSGSDVNQQELLGGILHRFRLHFNRIFHTF